MVDAGPRGRPPSGVDLERVFAAVPGLYFALTPELVLVAATDEILRATSLVREEVLGRNVFDVLPDEPSAAGVESWRASLERVRATKEPHTMGLTKYSVPSGAGLEEKYWEPMNSRVLAADGELVYIIHRTVDRTPTQRSARSASDHKLKTV